MNKTQISILKNFYNLKKIKFNNLKGEVPSNKFSYYINKLVKENYLYKGEDGYILTDKGEKYLTYLNKIEEKKIKQPIQNILLFPLKGNKYLFQKRDQRPFLGIFGPIGAKTKIGETIFETANKRLFEDTGLNGEIKYKGILEVRTYKNKKLFLHYFMNLFKITHLKGQLKNKVKKGENIWITEKEYSKYKNKITGMNYHFEIIKSKSFMVIELNQYMDEKGNFIKSKLISKLKV
ncbi:MAG: hypothetical protein WC356_07145 [Candidatus Micrarchaeia archaeon]|jgi:ADP-ribose pyrophosphatase YjhB (NUDIX family)